MTDDISILVLLVSAKNQPGKVLQLRLQNHVAAIVECETTSSWISLLLNCGCVFDRKEKLTPSVNIINCKCYKYMESLTGKSERTKNTILFAWLSSSLFFSNLQVCIYVNA